MESKHLQRNGPWVAIIIAIAAIERWALKNDNEATLTRFIRRLLRSKTKSGEVATWGSLIWLGRHLTKTDKTK